MKDVKWEFWKCRCSAISKLMTTAKGYEGLTEAQEKELQRLDAKAESGTITPKQKEELAYLIQKQEKGKQVVLGDDAVRYLLDAYAWETEGMCSITKEMDVEYFDRGRQTEPESIDLLSLVDGYRYVKNDYRYENDFLSGIPDILKLFNNPEGQEVSVGAIRDIKSTKDYPTFLFKMHKGLDSGNKEQLQGYGDILKCGDLGVAFTLPDMPESIRNGYKMKLAYKMDEVSTESPRFLQAWNELERSMKFKHMDPDKRVYQIPVVAFKKAEQQAVYERVKIGREWLFSFDRVYRKIV